MDKIRFIPPVSISEFLTIATVIYLGHILFAFTGFPMDQGSCILALIMFLGTLFLADCSALFRRWFGPLMLWGLIDGIFPQTSLIHFINTTGTVAPLGEPELTASLLWGYFLLASLGLAEFMLLGVIGSACHDEDESFF